MRLNPTVCAAGNCTVDDSRKARRVAEEVEPTELEFTHGLHRVSYCGVTKGKAHDDFIGTPLV